MRRGAELEETAGDFGEGPDRRQGGAGAATARYRGVRDSRRRLEAGSQHGAPGGGPEFELFDATDPLNRRRRGANPDIVERLAKALDGWQEMAAAARLKPDTETAKTLSPEQLQRLRSLGYVR